MLFTINDLGFSIAGLLLEGWLAFAARCVCALALLFIGWVVSRWLQKSLFPRLLKRMMNIPDDAAGAAVSVYRIDLQDLHSFFSHVVRLTISV